MRRTLLFLCGLIALTFGMISAAPTAAAAASTATIPNFCVLEYMNSTTVTHHVFVQGVQAFVEYDVHYHNELDGYFDGAHFCGSIVSITTVTLENCQTEFNTDCYLNATVVAKVVSGSASQTGTTNQVAQFWPAGHGSPTSVTITAQSPFLNATCGAATGCYSDQYYASGWLGSGQKCAP